MSTFHGSSAGLLSATTTFGVATLGVAFVPALSSSTFFRVVAFISYLVLATLLLSFIARQLAVRKYHRR
jgi:hypothetical protein